MASQIFSRIHEPERCHQHLRQIRLEIMESPGGGLRDTSVVVLTLDTSIIVSLSSRNDTQVIYIDPTTGSLRHNQKLGYDVFNSQDEALNYMTNGSRSVCKSITYGRAILGYAVLGSSGLLLVATKLNASIPNLPGDGCVYTVSESQWIKIILQNLHVVVHFYYDRYCT